jgi:hypothetical protein
VPEYIWPAFGKHRGPGFWNVTNLWKSRKKILRADNSNAWRYAHESANPPPVDRSVSLGAVIPDPSGRFRIAILGDTGEGDRSQYALVPLLRAANPDFMIINGDVAYPSGDPDDFVEGFFRPYQGMGIPVWATAGNHEYYSNDNGRTFYETFCGRVFGPLWARYGLRQVPQPGMYWELGDPSGDTPLVIIGIDSGKAANLDGHNSWLSSLFNRKSPDVDQLEWLEWRLSLADSAKSKVVVLFHIPALVRAKHDKVHLGELHRILARHPSVSLVVCGHIHHHEEYDGATFGKYLMQEHGAEAGGGGPRYIVSGNGGATLDGTDLKGGYPPTSVYPSVQQWKDYTGAIRRAVDSVASGSPLSRVVGQLPNLNPFRNDDPPGLQSFLLLDVDPKQGKIDVSHVQLDNLDLLFTQQPPEARIAVAAPSHPLDPGALAQCTKYLFGL